MSEERKPERKPWAVDVPGSIHTEEVRIIDVTDKPEPVTPGAKPGPKPPHSTEEQVQE